ncbi:ATPase [Streptomyces sp. NPDC058665]|uniref:RapZ C-terminal domain-containing protein n=1 Tax=Streptomyces sp. NPDC058665 TaxID=3346586 RepID=UPI0036689B5B
MHERARLDEQHRRELTCGPRFLPSAFPEQEAHGKPPFRHTTKGHHRHAVRTAVRNTPGITDLVAMLTGAVLAYRSGPSAHRHPVTVATGCAGGRHRAGSVALDLADALREHGVSSTVTHRDLHRPVVDR